MFARMFIVFVLNIMAMLLRCKARRGELKHKATLKRIYNEPFFKNLPNNKYKQKGTTIQRPQNANTTMPLQNQNDVVA